MPSARCNAIGSDEAASRVEILVGGLSLCGEGVRITILSLVGRSRLEQTQKHEIHLVNWH
jgi:hypothetical protein